MADGTVPKAELLERERRWSRPAGVAAVLGAVLAVASVALQQSAIGSGVDTDAERLVSIHEHTGEFLLGNVLQGLAFLLFAAPLWYLFKATEGRTELVRRVIAILALIGPALLLVSNTLSGTGLADVSDQFNEELPSLEREEQAAQRQRGDAAGDTNGAERTATTATQSNTEAAEATEPESSETGSTATEDSSEQDEEDTPKENRAEDLAQDSGTVSLAGILGLPGILGFVVGMVYIPLWAMRTGLLTRFWGSLGMALGVVVVILPPAQVGLLLWFAAIGLMLIGVWPGDRPPAWEEGRAIPWRRPGEPPPGPGDGTVEGSGREVSEAPLPEEPPPDAPPQPDVPPHPGSAYEGESQGQRRKKRKRRS